MVTAIEAALLSVTIVPRSELVIVSVVAVVLRAVAGVLQTTDPVVGLQVTPMLPVTDETPLPPVAFAITNAVVANCVVLVPTVAVGAVGVPVKAGLASGASSATL